MDHTVLPHLLPFLAIAPFFMLFFMAIVIIPFWMIWKKAGFSPWLSLLMCVPLVSLIMLYVLAFSEWRVVPARGPAALQQF